LNGALNMMRRFFRAQGWDGNVKTDTLLQDTVRAVSFAALAAFS
jgi:hypothetical protein